MTVRRYRGRERRLRLPAGPHRPRPALRHGYRVPLVAVLILRPGFSHTYGRAAARLGGTVFGLIIAGTIVQLAHPGPLASGTLSVISGGLILLFGRRPDCAPGSPTGSRRTSSTPPPSCATTPSPPCRAPATAAKPSCPPVPPSSPGATPWPWPRRNPYANAASPAPRRPDPNRPSPGSPTSPCPRQPPPALGGHPGHRMQQSAEDADRAVRDHRVPTWEPVRTALGTWHDEDPGGVHHTEHRRRPDPKDTPARRTDSDGRTHQQASPRTRSGVAVPGVGEHPRAGERKRSAPPCGALP
ncbi:FUSC family protein [Streptomyces sp. G1]|uniref:FUSC family protein n=1 Tax=Streptomyces sp. G1 TaxID=361572 RepID=UPI0035ABB7B8